MNHTTAACATLIGLGAATLALPVALATVGFGAGGVVAGSVAAGVQSAVYGGTTGGLFAVAQSIGAAGLAGRSSPAPASSW
ncbi:hypothetical protein Q8F55_003096 [Vanrija albida]|uniref:Uncharacterized protein n=1 Tax=Vanrija albida TaxID=181172 RepID=A0ABR3QBK5_9TREE